ncbi:hypothetical protein [Nesterenkonia jeotgali]|uniref:Uncharacterized small protein (DUF1192 family) n=1 Tax=Nesterenkonia jeotgali TaxID=317018 RepID=A0A839FFB3_9MICC|nr:hypothetical protein [Nesterenkonia jeotgali]MBA8920358.1 uncharacterized small protein (DUF1192 family) [Nesterenkonia jeotgali]
MSAEQHRQGALPEPTSAEDTPVEDTPAGHKPHQPSSDSPQLSVAELESEIAQAETLVQELNQRLKRTVDESR